MLKPQDKKIMEWSIKKALLEQSATMTENKQVAENFIVSEATYEQLLNLTFNPFDRDDVYMEAEDLESLAKHIVYEISKPAPVKDLKLNEKFNLLKGLLENGKIGQVKKVNVQEAASVKAESDASAVLKQHIDNKSKKGVQSKIVASEAACWYLYKKLRTSGNSQKASTIMVAEAAAKCGESQVAERWQQRALKKKFK